MVPWHCALNQMLQVQGTTIEEARSNQIEALELFSETASPEEVQQR
jgi:predicted RNase H-like HicB family nuclease